MTYNFHDRLDYLGTRKKTLDSESVTISNGTNTVGVSATVGETDVEEEGPNGLPVRTQIRDYIITAEDLVLNGVQVEPQEGWTITEGDLTCRVVPIGDQSCFDYTTQTKKRMRIHTVVVSEDD